MLQTKYLRGRKRLIHLSGLLMLSVFANSYAAISPITPSSVPTTNPNGTPVYHTPTDMVNTFDKPVPHPPIPLLDEEGVNVLTSQKAYSPKKSCAGSGCHDYEKISSAYHFQMGRDEADDDYGKKRGGLPQLVSPGYYGGYSCMGGSNAKGLSRKHNTSAEDFADYGSAGFVKGCYGCHSGGGFGEYDREGIRYDQKNIADIKPFDGDYYEPKMVNGKIKSVFWDWKKSGVAEADCMICHTDIASVKVPSDSGLKALKSPVRLTRTRGQFMTEGFFREGATGLLEVVTNTEGKNLVTIKRSMQPKIGHDGKPTLDKDGNPVKSLKMDLDAAGKPQFTWHADAFDSRGRAIIPMLRFPANQNCMQCHSTSNSRRGFYGFGESAKSTIEGAGLTALNGGATGVLVDDYQDDVHKGKKFVMDNGEMRVINTCNSCHDKQYYKSPLASVDLNADHNFNKGNSDMDVRNDLDYAPDAMSCEFCHVNAKTPIIPSGHDSQLAAHREIWKGRGYMSGYSKASLNKVTQRHFDVVSCQACHVVNKKGRHGKPLQIMYRYRVDQDGKSKMTPYNPKNRYYWQDKTSGYVIPIRERTTVLKPGKPDAKKQFIAQIIDPISGKSVGKLPGHFSRYGVRYSDPTTYEDFVALKKAYDHLLTKKGYTNPDTTLVWTESNEYLMSHNVRPSPQAMPCGQCHQQKQNGSFSSLVSPKGVLGKANIKVIATVPDNRLVEEGIITLGLPYMKLQANGDITENVEDILFATRIDPFMTILKNSSANEVLGRFNKVKTADLLAGIAGTPFAANMQTDFVSSDSFLFQVNKGTVNLRNMVAAIDGNLTNKLLFPTYSGVMGKIMGAEAAVQGILDAGQYGKLRSDVFYFDVQDRARKSIQSLNGAYMYVKAAYKGNRSDLNSVNVITADMGVTAIKQIPASDILMIQPASQGNPLATVQPSQQTNEGFVIFRTTTLGYFIVADK